MTFSSIFKHFQAVRCHLKAKEAARRQSLGYRLQRVWARGREVTSDARTVDACALVICIYIVCRRGLGFARAQNIMVDRALSSNGPALRMCGRISLALSGEKRAAEWFVTALRHLHAANGWLLCAAA